MIGFQKSQFSDRDSLKFTVNLKVVSKAVWDDIRQQRPHFPAKPSPNTGYGNFEWHKRIGLLMPERTDRGGGSTQTRTTRRRSIR